MAGPDSKGELLRKVPLFAKLGNRELAAVEQLTDVVELPAGHVLMHQGQTGNEAFVLVSGNATVTRDGHELAKAGPGTVLGEIALISEGPRVATVTLDDASTLLVIGHREFHSLLDGSPDLLRAVFDELAHRIRNLEADRPH